MSDESDDAFLADLKALFGQTVRSDPEFARELYCAVTQVTWTHLTKGESGFSYRGGDRALRRLGWEGGEFYDDDDSGRVSDRIAQPLHEIGWHYESLIIG